jgi:biopolymer transport protein ExbB/TolQ
MAPRSAPDLDDYCESCRSTLVASRQNRNFVGLIVSGSIFVAAPFVGVAVTTFWLQRAFREVADVDPSQKARLLALRISESMNGAACGIVVSCVALVPAIIFAIRSYRDSKRQTPPDVDS